MAITAAAVRAIVAKEAGIDESALRPDATLSELDISSLDVVSAGFEIEDQFGIAVEPDAISPDWTLARFVDHIVSLDPS